VVRRVGDVLARFEPRIRIAPEIKLEPLVGRNRIGGAPRQQGLEVRNDQGIDENGAGGLELRNILSNTASTFLKSSEPGSEFTPIVSRRIPMRAPLRPLRSRTVV
jgi:hypothetical protein